ncbi:MAG: threonine synthase, partial [Flavobacteriales bacterium CG_4_8_14_3_um_filter_35_10]
MKYISTRQKNETISFKEATLNGLAKDGGLYVPNHIPSLPKAFFDQLETYSNHEIAFAVLKPFVSDSLTETQLKSVIFQTLSFP